MDTRAKWIRTQPGSPITFPRSKSLWTIEKEGQPIVRKVTATVREHCNGTAARQYWMEKEKIGQCSHSEVAWSCTGTAMQEIDSERRRWITKHSTGWCAVNRNTLRWKMDTVDTCSRCKAPNETAPHVWTCKSTTARAIWEKAELDLEGWFTEVQTCPSIARIISSRVRCWRAGTRHRTFHTFRHTGLREATAGQDKMGWDAAFEGNWHIDWIEVQQRYYQFVGSRRTGKRWLVSLIKKLWDIAWDLWKDRNHVNAQLKTARLRAVLEKQVSREYHRGYLALHLQSHKLFTNTLLIDKLTKSDQQLESWLMRVTPARDWAASEPEQVQKELEDQRNKQHRQDLAPARQQVRESAQRVHMNMQHFMSDWLQRDQPDS